MNMAIFSLHEVIREYNEGNGTQFSPEENFGYHTLSSDRLKRVEERLRELGDFENNLKVVKNTYGELSHQIDENHHQYLQEREAWYERQIACFDNEEFWDGLLSRDDLKKANRKVLLGLREMWVLQRPHINHNSAELEHIAVKILPEIVGYLRDAKAECRHQKASIPKSIKRQFKAYIATVENAVQEYKDTIIKSMLVRLKIAEEYKNWKMDDVVMYLLKRIDQQGLLDVGQKRIFQSREGMSQKTFAFFVDYILSQGSAEQKMGLVNGVWFRRDVNFKKVKHGDRYCLVPTEMVGDTPRFYFSSTLFKHRHFRHDFLHRKIALISRLKTLNTHTKISKHLSISMAEKLFEDLFQLEGELKNAFVEAESWRVTNWKRFLHRKTNRFVSAFAHFTGVETQKLAQKKSDVIHMLRLRVEADLTEANQEVDYINPHLMNRALELCEQLSDEGLKSRVENDRSYFQKLLSLSETKQVPCIEIANDTEPEFSDDFSSESVPTPKEIEAKGVFEASAQVDLTTLTDRNFGQLVSMLTSTIQDLPPKADDEHLHSVMSKYFISYLEFCNEFECTEQFLDKKERVLKIENLLEQHGPVFIKTRIGSLIKIRDSENNWFGFKTLCEIYLQSCALQDNSHLSIK